MTGTIIANTLRTSWKQVLYWGLGMGAAWLLCRLHRL